MTAVDPTTSASAPLFNPRTDRWLDHFIATETLEVVGVTAVGRATIALLKLNRPLAVEIRREEATRGAWP